jgi:hypothetical protein
MSGFSFRVLTWQDLCSFSNRGGVIMQGTDLVVTATLCFELGILEFQLITRMPANNRCFSVAKAWLF